MTIGIVSENYIELLAGTRSLSATTTFNYYLYYHCNEAAMLVYWPKGSSSNPIVASLSPS